MSLYLGNNLVSGVVTPIEPTRNIGQIIQSTIPLSDAGLHLLDGSLLSGDGVYKDFYNYMIQIYNNYPNLFCTEEQWQQYVATDGACNRFVLNTTNKTIRLGLLTGFIEGTNSLSDLGALTAAGVPNITGRVVYGNSGDIGVNNQYVSGAFYSDTGTNVKSGSSGSQTNNHPLLFNASRSSPIYGRSNTVQPQSIKVLYYIVIATSTKTDVQVDIDRITTDLNGKASIDLSNCTKPHIVETYVNGTSWYRVYSDGWCEQGGRINIASMQYGSTSVSLLKPFNNTNYTITIGGRNLTLNGNPCFAVGNSVTTNSFNIWMERSTGSNHDNQSYWQACGYMN